MFHMIYVTGVSVVFPVISIIADYLYNKKKQSPINPVWLSCKWFIFWTLGIRSVSAGCMQLLNPAYTQALLQLDSSSHMVIQELGGANIAMGLMCILSFFKPTMRKQAASCVAVFMTAAAVLHITRIGMSHTGELISLANDVFSILIAVVCLFQKTDMKRNAAD